MVLFISYSHDSEMHRERVLALSERLRDDGYDTRLDQYVNGTPLEGWPRWMLNRVDEASHVLVVCTETYYRRFRGQEVPDRGFGVDWEGMLITHEIYNARSQTLKFVPVLFEPSDQQYIPEPLRGGTHYTLTSQASYDSLRDFLDGVAGVEARPVGTRRPRERRHGTPLTFELAGTKPDGSGATRIWHLPQPRNPHFVGREELLSDLQTMLRSQGPTALVQVVAGLGGVGKTQLAVEYAYRHREEYALVWSVRCEQSSTLASDYAALAARLDLPQKDAADLSLIVQAVRQWFETHGQWLLIFDNVEQPEDLADYLPENPQGDVIITSRHQQWYGHARKLTVATFRREESLALLLGPHPQPQSVVEAADALARELGDLPLALAQAAAYLDATGTTIEGYLSLFRERRAELWSKESSPPGHQKTVAETFSLAVERLREEPALRLLNLCALLAPENIPHDLLLSAVGDELELGTQLAALRRYSLVDVAAGMVSVHRLVQTVCRDRWSETERTDFTKSAVQLVNSAWPPGNFQDAPATWPVCARLTPHARAVLPHAPDYATASRLWDSLGTYLFTRAEFADAGTAFENAVRIAKLVYGAESTELATRLNNLAQLLKATNRLAEAEPLMRRALEITEQSYGAEHPDVAIRLNNLALLLHATNRLVEAEPLMRRALDIGEKTFGAEHPKVAIRLNNLALLLKATNRLAEAEPLMRRGLAIEEKSRGVDHPFVAIQLHNLARLLQATNRLAEAEPLMRRALDIWRASLGDEHPSTLTAGRNYDLLLAAIRDAGPNAKP